MQIKRLIEKEYDAVTIDGAKQTEAIDSVEGQTLTYHVVASEETTISGAAIQIQGSLDGTNWHNLGTAVNVTADGNYFQTEKDLAFRYYRLSYTRSGGSYVATTRVLLKGQQI